jgi:hypothetical protein
MVLTRFLCCLYLQYQLVMQSIAFIATTMVAGGNYLHKIVPDQGHNDQKDEFTILFQSEEGFRELLKRDYKEFEVKDA